jgi:prepilin-type N-terminal cleavage/methylation domain-containing protein
MTDFTTTSSASAAAPHQRTGFSLIEIIVAMTLIGIAFSSIMALQVKVRTRQSRLSEQSARNAILLQEINRVESMKYDTLATMLVNDTISTSTFSYIRRFSRTTGATPTGTQQHPWTEVKITIVPTATPSDSIYGVIRRTKTPATNALFTP